MDDLRQVTIQALGGKGHGLIELNGEAHYLKYALPGEKWELKVNGIPRRLSDSPQRVVAPCKHFGHCGGCVAQHMQENLYSKWKQDSLRRAFDRQGIEPILEPLRLVSRHSRRRAFLGVECHNEKVFIGFREEGRHDLVNMSECLVLDTSIVGILEDLKAIARIAMPSKAAGRLTITKLDLGLDVNFQNGLKQLLPEERAEIYRLSEKTPIVRLIVSGDTIVLRSNPCLTLGGVQIDIPTSVFLQAVPEAEQIMIEFVMNALPEEARHVCDLFCGIGTFSFPMAKKVSVSSFDSDRRAISALQQAFKMAQGLKPIHAHVRDLFREPLSAKELGAFDAVIYDPPRIGAAEQTARLSKSKVSTIIAISCSPSSFARDAKVLIEAGYKMGVITSVDQFMYSSHLECMAVFKKELS